MSRKYFGGYPKKSMKYQITWDSGNGHASGVLPETYATKGEAERAAAEWVKSMEESDPTGKGQYTTEVNEI